MTLQPIIYSANSSRMNRVRTSVYGNFPLFRFGRGGLGSSNTLALNRKTVDRLGRGHTVCDRILLVFLHLLVIRFQTHAFEGLFCVQKDVVGSSFGINDFTL